MAAPAALGGDGGELLVVLLLVAWDDDDDDDMVRWWLWFLFCSTEKKRETTVNTHKGSRPLLANQWATLFLCSGLVGLLLWLWFQFDGTTVCHPP